MLALQIALGIVLAVLTLRFWRLGLWLAAGGALAVLVVLLVLWAVTHPQQIHYAAIGIALLLVGVWREWRSSRAPTIRDP